MDITAAANHELRAIRLPPNQCPLHASRGAPVSFILFFLSKGLATTSTSGEEAQPSVGTSREHPGHFGADCLAESYVRKERVAAGNGDNVSR